MTWLALGNKIGMRGRRDGGFGSWPLLLSSPQRRRGYPRWSGKWLNCLLASQPIHMLSENILAPSGRRCLHHAFVWENLTHSQMIHGHLSSARLPSAHAAPALPTLHPRFWLCYTPRFRLVLQWVSQAQDFHHFLCWRSGFLIILFCCIVPNYCDLDHP